MKIVLDISAESECQRSFNMGDVTGLEVEWGKLQLDSMANHKILLVLLVNGKRKHLFQLTGKGNQIYR